MEMSDRIKDRRTRMGFTQEELAQKLGLQKSAIAKYEKGRVENIKRSTIMEMARCLNCSPAYLMGWDNYDDQNCKSSDRFQVSELEKNIIKKFRSLSGGERAMFLRSIGVEEKEDTIKMA